MNDSSLETGVLLDNQVVRTLSPEGPTTHSVHCLVDVDRCNESPYELVNELDSGDFGRSWRLASNDLIIDYAHRNYGCADCDRPQGAEGISSNGMRLTLMATVVDMGTDNTPPLINIADASDIDLFENFESVCGANATSFIPPNGMITSSGSLVRPILIHGSLMLIGWGVLLPSGAVIAAFGKHRPDAWWFKIHKVVQPIGLLFALTAWVIALVNFSVLDSKPDGSTLHFPHAVLGMITMVIGLLQPLNAIFRPHPPKEGEEATNLRRLWEICHKWLGWTGILLGLITVGMGTTLILDKANKFAFQVCYGVSIAIVVFLALFLNREKAECAYEAAKVAERAAERAKNGDEEEIEGDNMPLRSKKEAEQ